MYFRKFWRDSRLTFGFFLMVMVGIAITVVVTQGMVWDRHRNEWRLVADSSPWRAAAVWTNTLTALSFLGVLLAIPVGLSLGAAGVGDEFPNGSIEFLLTRPRSRRFFLWSGWAAGMLQIAAIFSLAILIVLPLLHALTGTVKTWRILALVPLHITAAAVPFGLSYFLTVLSRSGRQGFSLGSALVLLYAVAGALLGHRYKFDLPFVWNLAGHPFGEDTVPLLFLAAKMAAWSLVALAFPLGAQWILARRDV